MKEKDGHTPVTTNAQQRSVTPPPPPKKVTPPKRRSPRDLVNYKEFEVKEIHTLLEQDLEVSNDSDERDEKGENDDG